MRTIQIGWLPALLLAASAATASIGHHRAEDITGWRAMEDVSRTDTTLFEYAFTSGFDGWDPVDNTAAPSTWHPDLFNGVDETRNWWSASGFVGGYVDHTLLFLELPPIDLSATTSPLLSCDLFYALESPAGAPAPHDAWDACHVEVRVGAGSWQLLQPVSPAYNATNAFGFDEVFGHGVTGGWAGSSGGWQDASFDLTPYRGAATRVRFAFCSDDNTSWAQDPSLTGMQLDNIVIADADNVLLRNDADDTDFPGPTLHYSGVAAAGNRWSTVSNFHSPPTALRCDVSDQDVPVINSLVSPLLLLPANYDLRLDFWMRLDLPDFDGDGDTSLEDYFTVETSLNGLIWDELLYDYHDTETGSGNWYHFVDGGGHGRSTDISFLAGTACYVRFRVITDDNHDGGTGEGFYLDDVRILGEPQLAQDAGLVELRLPYPRSQDRPIDARISLQNFGSEAVAAVGWDLFVDNIAQSLGGQIDLTVGERVDLPFVYTPLQTSLHFPEGRLVAGDQYAGNDEFGVSSFIVRDPGVLELANDYSWNLTSSDFLHTTNAGESVGLGYAQHFTPPTMGENMGYAVDSLRLRFASYNIAPGNTAQWTLRVWPGLPGVGTPLHESDHVYSPSYAGGDASEDWVAVHLDGQIAPLQGDWWIEVVTGSEGQYHTPNDPRPVPNVTVVARSWEGQTSARVRSGVLTQMPNFQFNFHIFGHEEFIDAIEASGLVPQAARLAGVSPNPFNPTARVDFVLPAAGRVELMLYDLLGRRVALLESATRAAGAHTAMLDGSRLASGVYFVRLAVDGRFVDQRKTLLLK